MKAAVNKRPFKSGHENENNDVDTKKFNYYRNFMYVSGYENEILRAKNGNEHGDGSTKMDKKSSNARTHVRHYTERPTAYTAGRQRNKNLLLQTTDTNELVSDANLTIVTSPSQQYTVHEKAKCSGGRKLA